MVLIRENKPLVKFSRSQASLEFLITYGLILLIIGLTLSIIFSLGVFKPSSYVTKPIISGFSGISVTDAVTNGSLFDFYLTNNLNQPVNITDIKIITSNGSIFLGDYCSPSTLLYPGSSMVCLVNVSLSSLTSVNVNVNISYSISSSFPNMYSYGSIYSQVSKGKLV